MDGDRGAVDVRRGEFEPDELEFLTTEVSDSWSDGFEQGRTEVLDSLLPSVMEKVDAILAEDVDLPDTVLDLLEVLDRWIDIHRRTEIP